MGVRFARQIVKIKIFDSIENNVGARSTNSAILDPPFQSRKLNKKKLKSVALIQQLIIHKMDEVTASTNFESLKLLGFANIF